MIERYQLDKDTALVVSYGRTSVNAVKGTQCRLTIEKRQEPTPVATQIARLIAPALGLTPCLRLK
ncbi:MAG: hypothetical protein NC548_05835 [Lachnospiraceae bacterium]|nr:hypothetical protein [Lachnospiraceae bacterium]